MADAPYQVWGEDIEVDALKQMRNACKLPVAAAGALMPDAHVGYGLPIGGVLATRDAVIPYAVGVDIACRMKMTVLDLPVTALSDDRTRLTHALERETRFGVGASFKSRRQHNVMDADWRVTKLTAHLKDRAWAQLGTSGSGNHFVEFGIVDVSNADVGLPKGEYLALLSHSGSRGTGAQIASHYSKLARDMHPELPKDLSHLAWLDLASEAGHEYWAAMELMGRYAAANHAHSRAHRAGAECRHTSRSREPSQLRVARAACPPRRQRTGGHRASQGCNAGGRRRARDHPRLDGHSGVHRPRQGLRRFTELCGTWRRTTNEPHEGEADVHMGYGAALPARSRRHADLRRTGRSADGL